jgi:hypothetical protein
MLAASYPSCGCSSGRCFDAFLASLLVRFRVCLAKSVVVPRSHAVSLRACRGTTCRYGLASVLSSVVRPDSSGRRMMTAPSSEGLCCVELARAALDGLVVLFCGQIVLASSVNAVATR